MRQTVVEAFENYAGWTALFFLFISVKLALEGAAFVVDQDMSQTLRMWAHWPAWASIVTSIAGFGVYRWGLWRAKTRCVGGGVLQGYVFETVKRSAAVAFLVTFMTVFVLGEFMDHTDLPAGFFLKVAGAVSSGSFSICFLVWNFAEGLGGHDRESVA